jgi:hypothetical protein
MGNQILEARRVTDYTPKQGDRNSYSIESNGYAVVPSFLRKVDVHIQQVLERAARNPQR